MLVKEMTPQFLNEAFIAKTTIIKVFSALQGNPMVPIFWDIHARGGKKLRTDTTHTLILFDRRSGNGYI